MKLIYIHTGLSSFVEKDIRILKEHFEVEIWYFSLRKKWFIPFRILLFAIRLIVRKQSILIHQFGGFHSLPGAIASTIRNHKCVIVLGGTDCVSFPSIDYGNFNKKGLGFATTYSFKKADLLLPVHDSLVLCDYTYQPNDFNQQGYQAHIKGIVTPFETIHNGYDSTAFVNNENNRIKNSFVTIGAGLNSRFGFELKGIDLIVELAKSAPDIEFHIIGGVGLEEKILSPNIILHPIIPNNQLSHELNKYEFYFQLSMSEGFPNALCEAMLCGCIPLVSNVGAMPMITENIGGLLKKKDLRELEKIVSNLVQMDADSKKNASSQARQRILNDFDLLTRKTKLIAAIEKLVS